jgi:acyl carrier protein
MTDNVEKLRSVFRESLGLEVSASVDTLNYRAISEWDSVAHMVLISGIEGAFDVMLSTEDVIALSSFAEAKRILASQGVDIA